VVVYVAGAKLTEGALGRGFDLEAGSGKEGWVGGGIGVLENWWATVGRLEKWVELCSGASFLMGDEGSESVSSVIAA